MFRRPIVCHSSNDCWVLIEAESDAAQTAAMLVRRAAGQLPAGVCQAPLPVIGPLRDCGYIRWPDARSTRAAAVELLVKGNMWTTTLRGPVGNWHL